MLMMMIGISCISAFEIVWLFELCNTFLGFVHIHSSFACGFDKRRFFFFFFCSFYNEFDRSAFFIYNIL